MRVFALAYALMACVAMAYAGEGNLVEGTFVQKKILKDVDVTLKSEGVWSFEKGKSFTWRTLRPLPSVFIATPTNYSFTVGGRTAEHSLNMRIDDVSQIFAIKEMKEFVAKVDVSEDRPLFSTDGVVIPHSLTVFFKNGDRLEIELKR